LLNQQPEVVMLTQQQPLARKTSIALMLAALLFVPATRAVAQEEKPSSFLLDVGKRVALDPTTYAPAIVAFAATRQDWVTSQPLFQHGMNELNPRFTVSGLPNDTPISYEAGNRRIVLDALINLQASAVSNFAGTVVERMLVERYPAHHKLIHGLGWVERIALSSFLSYKLSSQHFRQAQANEQLARQLGYIP
jgi:hypothetical protein